MVCACINEFTQEYQLGGICYTDKQLVYIILVVCMRYRESAQGYQLGGICVWGLTYSVYQQGGMYRTFGIATRWYALGGKRIDRKGFVQRISGIRGENVPGTVWK